MKQIFSGFNLIAASICTLFVLGSSVEHMPADAGIVAWTLLLAITALAVTVGIQGARTIERN